jgi:hypothetical protein
LRRHGTSGHRKSIPADRISQILIGLPGHGATEVSPTRSHLSAERESLLLFLRAALPLLHGCCRFLHSCCRSPRHLSIASQHLVPSHLVSIRVFGERRGMIGRFSDAPHWARIAASSSRKAVNFSSARTTNRFPSSQCASAIQIIRTRSKFETVGLPICRLFGDDSLYGARNRLQDAV